MTASRSRDIREFALKQHTRWSLVTRPRLTPFAAFVFASCGAVKTTAPLEAGPPFDATPGRDAVLEAVRERGLASGCLFGTYERPDASISEAAGESLPLMTPPLAG